MQNADASKTCYDEKKKKMRKIATVVLSYDDNGDTYYGMPSYFELNSCSSDDLRESMDISFIQQPPNQSNSNKKRLWGRQK